MRNTVSGTHRGAFMGLEPSKRIEMRTMDVHQVRGGMIVATWHLEDFAGLLHQLNDRSTRRSRRPGADTGGLPDGLSHVHPSCDASRWSHTGR